MTRHFGVLIPSTNTTVETELARLPAGYQARLLGTAKVEMVILIQTSASLFADDYDEATTRRMSAAAGVPAITSAQSVGRALRALGARRIALVSPYSEDVNARARRYFSGKHGLEIAVVDGFAATDSYAIGKLEPEKARDSFARIDRPEIDAFVVPGANFPTMASIAQSAPLTSTSGRRVRMTSMGVGSP